MKIGFYPKIAISNLQKNSRFYLPLILTSAGLQACFYIILTLMMDERMKSIRGGYYISTCMVIGTIVMTLLSTILLFYTNSFLMKQRKREFGLYNVLGMEKRHVGRILFFETFISCGCSVLLGTVLGVVFYKLCTLLICNIMKVDSVFGFYYIKAKTLIPSALLFIALNVITYLFNRISIRFMKPVELLSSAHTGEKEPKVKWILFLLGAICLGAGYGMALTIKSPLAAVNLFLWAVLLVIVGTYFLFIAGSIAILKLLKKNKKFYYNSRHMISVSGLIYRMKQNAVGLASITIMATAVLVMLSTTVSLYAGIEDSLNRRYSYDFKYHSFVSFGPEETYYLSEDTGKLVLGRAAAECGLEVKDIQHLRYLELGCCMDGNVALLDTSASLDGIGILENLMDLIVMSAPAYENCTGIHLDLAENEAAFLRFSTGRAANINLFDATKREPAIILEGLEFYNAQILTDSPVASELAFLVDSYLMVVSDDAVLEKINQVQQEAYGIDASFYDEYYGIAFQSPLTAEEGDAFKDAAIQGIRMSFQQMLVNKGYDTREIRRCLAYSTDSKWEAAEDVYGLDGSLFFLGLILGLVFLFATALVIYYKQISEGYEDRERFQIMQKVGMSSKEVRSTISFQILLMFFLPLLVAGIHLSVAFPLLGKLLQVLQLYNMALFAKSAVLVFFGFAVVYVLIYSMTAKVYYKLVH